MTRNFYEIDLGTIGYEDALVLQEKLVRFRLNNPEASFLLLLEHNPVFSLGRRGERSDILVSDDTLVDQGIEVCKTPRGGQVTYHGPGQLVGYIVARIQDLSNDVWDMIHSIENTLMLYLLKEHGLHSDRIEGQPGVWLSDPQRKIASIGMKITRNVTSHGYAMNLQPNMEHWQMIVPCGQRSTQVTSVIEETGQEADMAAAKRAYARCFQEIFDLDLRTMTADELDRII